MAWPFTGVTAPNIDSGFVAVPTSLTDVPTVATHGTAIWLIGASFSNGTADVVSITVEDGASTLIINALEVGPGQLVTLEWAFMPATGLQWLASAAGVTGKIWGYA